eukprot:4319915-Prymnesium_polylepis.1
MASAAMWKYAPPSKTTAPSTLRLLVASRADMSSRALQFFTSSSSRQQCVSTQKVTDVSGCTLIRNCFSTSSASSFAGGRSALAGASLGAPP